MLPLGGLMALLPGSRWINGAIDINNLLGLVFGVVFLSVMLGFATWYANPTPFQLRVYITVLALAAGGIGAALPGKFDIRYKGFVRASGALGLIALVYLNQPTIEQHTVQLVPPSTSPDPIATSYLKAIDDGDVASVWNQLDPAARGFTFASFDQLKQIYESFREPLGAAVKRELVGNGTLESPPGMPTGLYRSLNYRTKFVNTPSCRAESVVLRATDDLKWRVFSNQISATGIEC